MSVMDPFGYNAGVVASIQIAVNLTEILLLASYFGLNSKESPLAIQHDESVVGRQPTEQAGRMGLQERLAQSFGVFLRCLA